MALEVSGPSDERPAEVRQKLLLEQMWETESESLGTDIQSSNEDEGYFSIISHPQLQTVFNQQNKALLMIKGTILKP